MAAYYAPVFNTSLSDIENARDFTPMSFNQLIFFGKGRIDDWGAWMAVPTQEGYYCALPSDKYYFGIVDSMVKIYGQYPVFLDFVRIFVLAGKTIDPKVVNEIRQMATRYSDNENWALNMMLHVYYGMVAEENKENTKIGKQIKMLGLYDIIFNGKSVEDAACCNIGRDWGSIKAEADFYHLYRF